MSFPPTHSGPGFPSRPNDSPYWQGSSNHRGGYGLGTSKESNGGNGLGHKIHNFLSDGDKALPLYKDKPYMGGRSRKGGALTGKRRVIGAALGGFIFVLWLFGFFSSSKAKGAGLDGVSGSAGLEDVAGGGGSIWKWIVKSEQRALGGPVSEAEWRERKDKVREAFAISWDGYEKYGWGFDEYHPVSKSGRHMVDGGMGWIIVDALDTLMLMNLTSRVKHAREWIHTSLKYNQNHEVNTFETTIRMLGGLLSAHYLSTSYPELAPIADDDEGAPGEDLYIEKATDLADRLMGAYESGSGVPYASVNLNTSRGVPSHMDGGASSTAEATTLQLEMKYLSKLTGEPMYWQTAERVMKVVDDNEAQDGLVPIYIHADSGTFRGSNIRLGSRGDSYYEYLIKQYLQTSKAEPVYLEMWDEAMIGIRKHLITYTTSASLTVLGERQNGLGRELTPKMDHLVCFMPGTIALGATNGLPLDEARKDPSWGKKQEDDMDLARELMKTCWATYLATDTGLAPEITYFNIDSPHRTMDDAPPKMNPSSTSAFSASSFASDDNSNSLPLDRDPDAAWRRDINIHRQDVHNLQRPETVESLFYMYRITGDVTYREWGWEMFRNFVEHTAVYGSETHSKGSTSTYKGAKYAAEDPDSIVGFTSLGNADTLPAQKRDNMESFWLAETLKYFYLLFSDKDFMPLEKTVINTEAHIFPRFELKEGGELKTGWKRKKSASKETVQVKEKVID